MARRRRNRGRGGRPPDRLPAAYFPGPTLPAGPSPRGSTGPPPPAGPSPRGFDGPGYRRLYGWLLPGLAGAEGREALDDLSGAVVLAGGMVGAGLGFAYLGWLGGALGLVAGISAGGEVVERRHHRG